MMQMISINSNTIAPNIVVKFVNCKEKWLSARSQFELSARKKENLFIVDIVTTYY